MNKESIMTNNRPAPRSPGRTPPFILVGLMVLVCVLAYNYWSLSATNGDLTARTEKLDLEVRSSSDALATTKKSLEEAQEQNRAIEVTLDQVRQQLKDREADISNLRNQESRAETETNTCKEDLSKCDEDLTQRGQTLESVTNEKKALEEELAALKGKEVSCNLDQCLVPVQNMVAIFSRVVDPQKLRQSLIQAEFDANRIMGPENNPQGEVPNPNQAAPQGQGAPQEVAPQGAQQEGAQPQEAQQQEAPQEGAEQQGGQPNVEANAEKSDDKVMGSTMSTDKDYAESSTPASSNITSEKLVFQPKANLGEEKEEENFEDQTDHVVKQPDVIRQNIGDEIEVDPNEKTNLQMGGFARLPDETPN